MRGLGRAVFVAILLLIAGTLNIIYGIAAIADANFWVNENHFVIANLNTWGWITRDHRRRPALRRVLAVRRRAFRTGDRDIAASFGALGALLSVGGAYPFWSLGVFAICLWCIHGLVVYGEPLEEEKRLPGRRDPGAGAPRG